MAAIGNVLLDDRPGRTGSCRDSTRAAQARVGRGAGALGARGAEKQRPGLGRGAQQTAGALKIQTAFMGTPKKRFQLTAMPDSRSGLPSTRQPLYGTQQLAVATAVH